MTHSRRATAQPRPLHVAGIMGGTSGDGLDIALVRIAPRRGDTQQLSLRLLAHRALPFPPQLRRAVLAAQDAEQISTASLARLHWRLGLAYAEALTALQSANPARIDLVGCHGQTIYHQGEALPALGRSFRCTWQIGEMAPLAAAAGVPVISNFRPADMVAGGQGAPLVPLLDVLLYRHRTRTRILQNIGGIANLTLVPPANSAMPVLAFDTGPGNMVMDALMQQLYSKPFDRGGRIAAQGAVVEPVAQALLARPYFRKQPPRSAGREQFGPRYADTLLRACRKYTRADADVVATACALTARSIADAIRRFCTVEASQGPPELILAGGGAKNATLLRMLTGALRGFPVRLLPSSDSSLATRIPVEAKEAAAFALLAYRSWYGLAGNVPEATGASQPVVLGQVTCG